MYSIINGISRMFAVYPKSETIEFGDQVAIFFFVLDHHPQYAFYKVSIIDGSENEKYTIGSSELFKDRIGWGFNLISRAELFDEKNGLLKDNTLTLAGEFKILNKSKFVTDVEKSTETNQLKKIYQDRSFTDLEIKIKDRSLKVHKVLLAASSSVLRQRLLELEEGSALELNDLDAEVAEEMINFIYDGRVKEMKKYSKELLIASEQYNMKQLKKFCEKHFFENLSVENVFETLKLSINHNASELKEECLEFMKE
jgi:hypothetical protein